MPRQINLPPKLGEPFGQGSYVAYILGFISSIGLSLAAFYLVKRHVDSGHLIYNHSQLLAGLASLGLVQLGVQLVAFLHLGRGDKARWNLLVFGFMLLVAIILVAGSLWIMRGLNYRSSPQQTNQYLIDQGSGGL